MKPNEVGQFHSGDAIGPLPIPEASDGEKIAPEPIVEAKRPKKRGRPKGSKNAKPKGKIPTTA